MGFKLIQQVLGIPVLHLYRLVIRFIKKNIK